MTPCVLDIQLIGVVNFTAEIFSASRAVPPVSVRFFDFCPFTGQEPKVNMLQPFRSVSGCAKQKCYPPATVSAAQRAGDRRFRSPVEPRVEAPAVGE